MTLPAQIAQQLREVLLDGRWVAATNLKEQLDDLTWEQAVAQIGDLNSIADLTFHIDYYIAGLVEVLEGGQLTIRDKYSFDRPPIESAADWEALRQKIYHDAARFAELVAQIPEDQIRAPFIEAKYGDNYRNFISMVEHCYYHLGQIVLLKKLLPVAKSFD